MKQDSIQKLNLNIEQLLQQDEKPLSFLEAAKYLDVSRSYLYKLTSLNKITHFKPNGKKIYFKKSDLDKYIYRNMRSSDIELDQRATDYVTQGVSL